MIEAAREYLAEKKMKEMADKVELMGYSQGANSTMATVYEMEKRGETSRIRAVHAGTCSGWYGVYASVYGLVGIDRFDYSAWFRFQLAGGKIKLEGG